MDLDTGIGLGEDTIIYAGSMRLENFGKRCGNAKEGGSKESERCQGVWDDHGSQIIKLWVPVQGNQA